MINHSLNFKIDSEQEPKQKQISSAFSQDQLHTLTPIIHMMLYIFGQRTNL